MDGLARRESRCPALVSATRWTNDTTSAKDLCGMARPVSTIDASAVPEPYAVKVACAVLCHPLVKIEKTVRTNGVTSVGQTPLSGRPTRSRCLERRHLIISSAWELRKSSCTLYGLISFIPRAALLRSLCEIQDDKKISVFTFDLWTNAYSYS
jgi:hypothetical protein